MVYGLLSPDDSRLFGSPMGQADTMEAKNLVPIVLIVVAASVIRVLSERRTKVREKQDECKRLAAQMAAVARKLGAYVIWDKRYTVLIRPGPNHPPLACRWFYDAPSRWQLLQLAWHRYRYGAHTAVACCRTGIPERVHVQAAKLRIELSEQCGLLNTFLAEVEQQRAEQQRIQSEQQRQQAERTRQLRLENLAKARAARVARRNA